MSSFFEIEAHLIYQGSHIYSMANGRDNYLADHPYGYKNLKERKEHEVLRGNAYNQSLEAQRDFNTHYKYAG